MKTFVFDVAIWVVGLQFWLCSTILSFLYYELCCGKSRDILRFAAKCAVHEQTAQTVCGRAWNLQVRSLVGPNRYNRRQTPHAPTLRHQTQTDLSCSSLNELTTPRPESVRGINDADIVTITIIDRWTSDLSGQTHGGTTQP